MDPEPEVGIRIEVSYKMFYLLSVTAIISSWNAKTPEILVQIKSKISKTSVNVCDEVKTTAQPLSVKCTSAD